MLQFTATTAHLIHNTNILTNTTLNFRAQSLNWKNAKSFNSVQIMLLHYYSLLFYIIILFFF